MELAEIEQALLQASITSRTMPSSRWPSANSPKPTSVKPWRRPTKSCPCEKVASSHIPCSKGICSAYLLTWTACRLRWSPRTEQVK